MNKPEERDEAKGVEEGFEDDDGALGHSWWLSLLNGRLDRVVMFETARGGSKNDCRGESKSRFLRCAAE